MSGANRKTVLIGHSGFLGGALASAIGVRGGSCAQAIGGSPRDFVKRVIAGKGDELVASLLAQGGLQDWICAVGIVDPKADRDVIEGVNVAFPCRLHELLAREAAAGTVRFVTIGSVLENQAELSATNPYLASKFRMFDALRRAGGRLRWNHFRLHTLYGGNKRPNPIMFAGQMFDALARGEPFKMSGGTQLREYHHVDDIAESILSFLAERDEDMAVELSAGEPLRLRDLATAVFAHFDASKLLEIGARGQPSGEVFDNLYRRSPYLAAYRDPVRGMISWFEEMRLAGA
jgi:nucleoside-diphosphate-sugar epimerase